MPRYSQAGLCAGNHDGAAITFDALEFLTYEGAARGNGNGLRSNGGNGEPTGDAAMTFVDMMRFSIESTDFDLAGWEKIHPPSPHAQVAPRISGSASFSASRVGECGNIQGRYLDWKLGQDFLFAG